MISYSIYKKEIESNFSKILDSNVLFWNLWNTTYAFEILEKYKDEYFDCFNALSEMWLFCWNNIDNQYIDSLEFKLVFEKNYPFVIDDNGEIINSKGILQKSYEDLSDDVLPELCINQLIYRFNTIYKGIANNESKYGLNACETSISIIDLILASNNLGFVFDNLNRPIVENEIEAQIKLIKKLSMPYQSTYENRNIYRDEEKMNSIKYQE